MEWTLANRTLSSRLLLGTARYPSPEILRQSIERSQTGVVTISLRRQSPELGGGENFWQLIRKTGAHILPNTAGCRTAEEAITLAHMARELFDTPWIKLEVIGDEETLQPHPFETVRAAQVLCREGFEVFPYTTEDLIVAAELVRTGCRILMPWGSPIGTGRGLANASALKLLRSRFPDTVLIVDAGLGAPSHAAEAMELGFDGVLLNTAVALAENPPAMAEAFSFGVRAGRMAYEAGLMPRRDRAQASTPVIGTPFWHTEDL